jgi:hypothetical protein
MKSMMRGVAIGQPLSSRRDASFRVRQSGERDSELVQSERSCDVQGCESRMDSRSRSRRSRARVTGPPIVRGTSRGTSDTFVTPDQFSMSADGDLTADGDADDAVLVPVPEISEAEGNTPWGREVEETSEAEGNIPWGREVEV